MYKHLKQHPRSQGVLDELSLMEIDHELDAAEQPEGPWSADQNNQAADLPPETDSSVEQHSSATEEDNGDDAFADHRACEGETEVSGAVHCLCLLRSIQLCTLHCASREAPLLPAGAT